MYQTLRRRLDSVPGADVDDRASRGCGRTFEPLPRDPHALASSGPRVIRLHP
jgi:hypothetical protein